MLPGSTIIISCPHCGQYAKRHTLISFNTIGSQLWSDAMQIAPMKPEFPDLVLCKTCNQFYWVKDANKVDEIHNFTESNGKYNNADFIEFPSFHVYYKALETISDEKFVRIRIWQCFNDYFREGKEKDITQDMQDLNTENLYALLKLMDESDQNGLLIKAEILRNLGWFEESKRFLNRVNDIDLIPIKDKFLVEINNQNKKVFQLY